MVGCMLTITHGDTPRLRAHPPVGVHLDVRGPGTDNVVELRLIGVSLDQRGTGLAEEALAALCSQADTHGWTVKLDATSDLGADLRRLVRWYSRHGFVPDRQEHTVIPHRVPMVRAAVAENVRFAA